MTTCFSLQRGDLVRLAWGVIAEVVELPDLCGLMSVVILANGQRLAVPFRSVRPMVER